MIAQNNDKSFVITNAIGWVILFAVNSIIQTMVGQGFVWPIVISAILAITGYIVTSLFREKMNRDKVFERRGGKILTYLFFHGLLIAFFVTAPAIIIADAFAMPELSSTQRVTYYLSNYINLTLIIGVWLGLYASIRNFINIRTEQVEKIKLEAALNQSKLNALIGQINPHFMFNTLNNIRGLILEDAEKARATILHLSEFLRYSLQSDQKDLQSLRQEMAIVEDFIFLAKIQYGEKLLFKKNIVDDIENLTIPTMSLQMLVENAIKHGISQVPKGGELNLTIDKVDNSLSIVVTNPYSSQNQVKSQSTGLGLTNIRDRLSLLYKDAANLNVKANKDTFEVIMTIPIMTNNEFSATRKRQ